jgi:alkanesulfonate monooxygenase SsuD/methylene tetrahydromethanopterin reductase-like flavin-dependent oxidoreductase (luciferase family)
VDIGLALPSFVRGTDRATILDWCRRIDDGPFSSLAVGERVAYWSHDLVTTLAFAAAATERVRLESTVAVLPLHEPVRLAKQAATIDVLSHGRLTLGVGVGGREQDYAAVGMPCSRRFARLDEQVAIMRAVWAGEIAVEGVPPIGPAPVQPGGPPLWTAAMGPKSLARSARWADGLAGFDLAPDPTGVDRLFRAAEEAWKDEGRATAPALTTSTWFALGHGAEDRLYSYAFEYLSSFGDEAARVMAGMTRLKDPGAIRDTVSALADVGCEEFMLVPTTDDVAEIDRLLDALG